MSVQTLEHRGRSWLGVLARAVESIICDHRLKARIRRERQMLAKLDDRALRDIGISRADAFLEASRPFDDVPSHRRCRD